MSTPGIEFINVKKSYAPGTLKPDSPLAVKGISFTVQPGTLTTILGPSGCGKTTTLRMIAGLEQPSAGQIKINGIDVTGFSPANRNVSLVFQSYALFPHMSVLDNVMYGLKASGIPTDQAQARAHATLDSVGLNGYAVRWPAELSGGQQQRVAVARALVLEPAVLLFDEPLSNLDAKLRRSMREEIRALQQRLKLTVVYVTHDQAEAMAVSDQIIVMNQGLIAQMGSPQQLYLQPNSEFVAAFMGDALIVPAQALSDRQIQLGSLTVTLAAAHHRQGPVKVAIRPEAWRLLSGSSVSNALPGKINSAAFMGAHYEYSVVTELGELLVFSPATATPHQVGDPVELDADPFTLAIVQ
jgi:iron(III) transport system ATP-binding protein